MRIWERLGGAVIAALCTASLMSQAEAVAAVHAPDDLSALADPAGIALAQDVFAVSYPEVLMIERLAARRAEEDRSVAD
jgi:hypothetical protein